MGTTGLASLRNRTIRLAAALVLTGAASAAANTIPAETRLVAADVDLILRQAVAEASARARPATIVVTDRVGNVLAVYAMPGAPAIARVDPGRRVVSPGGVAGDPAGLANLDVPATAAAISKAITGAYLSSGGNAFSTRTASEIIQENFVPGSKFLEGGPLFGVQISQLPCSDLSVRFASDGGGTIDPTIGPKRSPLGLAGDPGGLPLYKEGTLVGGIGVMADGVYGIDRDIRNVDASLDEILAVAGSRGFQAPEGIRADRIAVDGRLLRFSDAGLRNLRTGPAAAAAVNLATAGNFAAVNGYFSAGASIDGQAYGFTTSGVLPDPDGFYTDPRARVLATAAGANRFPPTAASDVGANSLTQVEVTGIVNAALGVALGSRAQIRRPLDSHVEVTVSVVDTGGNILAIARTADGPVFGTDVSLQKARTANFFTRADARTIIQGLAANSQGVSFADYVTAADAFLSRTAFDGTIAFSSRGIGNLSRPFFPDGQNGKPNGPLSVPFFEWSPFRTGLQVDAGLDILLQHAGFIASGSGDVAAGCVGGALLGNGLQIFSGGVPIFRNGVHVGAIGVSGDGIDQDDMTAFLGVHRAGLALGSGIGNADPAIRNSRLRPRNVTLRYVQCPYTPFLGSNAQNVCDGK
ncbi:MAG: heme-binding protein [Geminicoccaceae bacterium]|nr:heme-binding protein [Geminicoccaceae bacterium]